MLYVCHVRNAPSAELPESLRSAPSSRLDSLPVRRSALVLRLVSRLRVRRPARPRDNRHRRVVRAVRRGHLLQLGIPSLRNLRARRTRADVRHVVHHRPAGRLDALVRGGAFGEVLCEARAAFGRFGLVLRVRARGRRVLVVRAVRSGGGGVVLHDVAPPEEGFRVVAEPPGRVRRECGGYDGRGMDQGREEQYGEERRLEGRHFARGMRPVE
ncbi:uncharacterized protein B0H18DRAFT_116787 [Fomitopsis serialis]|uniref:uncharacterized protein n=1 Tax=Fomitopsis serialis TaxID=139415 RepID=UPI0020086253|nr:uncharacterized protein B0H18DRAFT_116787 [Neoantrodia serialis]KAH9930849.1 hypothetical protein B0H18DRAFT_116787 [Neoantrodia serialis]